MEKMKRCLNVEELAAYLGCGRSMAYELVHRADFPTVRLGRKIVIPFEALQSWLRKQTEGEEE